MISLAFMWISGFFMGLFVAARIQKTKRAALMLALLCLATPASATPFGLSWDGNPPGTLANLTGIADGQFALGHALFDAGAWLLWVDGGYAGWRDLDTVGALGTDGQSLVLVPPGPLSLGSLAFTMTSAWAFWGTSPSVDSRSTDPQWAFAVVGETLRWGWEDIAVIGGDRDYNDLYGRLERAPIVGPITFGPPTADEPTSTVPVPEPTTWVLMAVGLLPLAIRHPKARTKPGRTTR